MATARLTRSHAHYALWMTWGLASACVDGGQSFDDGLDGLDGRGGNANTTQTTPSTEPEASLDTTSDASPNDDESSAAGLSDTSSDAEGSASESGSDDEASATSEASATGSSAEDSAAEPTAVESTSAEPSETDSSEVDATSTADESPQVPLQALPAVDACIHVNAAGQLEVEVRHECVCPNTLGCTVEVEGDQVHVGVVIEQLDIPCPPACFVDTAQCNVELDTSGGTLVYGAEEQPFTLEQLAGITPTPDAPYGVCLPGPMPNAPSSGIPVADLCKQVTLLEQGDTVPEGELSVDLGGAVEVETIMTAAGCDEDNCCNWSWGYYVVRCSEQPGDLIVLTEVGQPFGSVVAPAEAGSDFEATEVTLGCQGMQCEPSCVPGDVADFGTATGELSLALDGDSVWLGEAISARAEFRIRSQSGL